MSERITGEEWFVGICLLIGLFLPHSNTIFMMANPIMCIMFYVRYRDERFTDLLRQVQIAFICAIVISFLFNITKDITFKSVLSALNICIALFVFPFFAGVRIRNFFLYFAIIYIISSQLCYVFHISALTSFFDSSYPIIEEQLNSFEHFKDNVDINSSITRFRFGGLYRNSNHCAKYVCMILAIFLTGYRQERLSKGLPFIVLVLLSILLTGSRTGLAVTLSILFVWVITNDQLGAKSKLFCIGMAVLGIMVMVFSAIEFRGFKIGEGLYNSAGSKYNTLLYYLNSENNILKLLFGNFDSSSFKSGTETLNKFDAEYGYIIFNFGIVGFIVYVAFWITMYRSLPKSNRFATLLLLWTISSTILLAYRSTFVLLFAFSRFLDTEEVNEDVETIED